MRLNFIRDPSYRPSLVDLQWGWPGPDYFEGDATEIIEQWRASFAISYDPTTFRQRLLDYSGGNDPRYVRYPTRLPAIDDAVLDAVVDAVGPRFLTLTDTEEPEPDEGPKS